MPLCFGSCLTSDDDTRRPHRGLDGKKKPVDSHGDPARPPSDHIVDIGEALESIRHRRLNSAPLPDLIREYGLSIPHAHPLRRKKTFEAPNQTALRLFAAHDAAKSNRNSWKGRLQKLRTAISVFQQPNDSTASFRSIMSSLNRKQTRNAGGHLPRIQSSSASVYLPVGAEFAIYGKSEESRSTVGTVIQKPGEADKSWSSLTSEEVAIWRYAAVTDSPVSDETTATSVSGPFASSLSSDDHWSVIMGTEDDDGEWEDILEWSRNVGLAGLRTRRGSSVANISDDSQTSSFCLKRDTDYRKST